LDGEIYIQIGRVLCKIVITGLVALLLITGCRRRGENKRREWAFH